MRGSSGWSEVRRTITRNRIVRAFAAQTHFLQKPQANRHPRCEVSAHGRSIAGGNGAVATPRASLPEEWRVTNMGQRANNGGRNASLDDKKVRAAGRQDTPMQGPGRDFDTPRGRGQVKGAFGSSGRSQKSGKSRALSH
jgi:hypothetical protein